MIYLFPACDLHCPGVESVCYGLCAPGARTPVVDDRLSDNTSPLVVMLAKFYSPGDVPMAGIVPGFSCVPGPRTQGGCHSRYLPISGQMPSRVISPLWALRIFFPGTRCRCTSGGTRTHTVRILSALPPADWATEACAPPPGKVVVLIAGASR